MIEKEGKLEYDLLFTLINKEDWKSDTSSGYFEPADLSENGSIRCFEGNNAEKIANTIFKNSDQLLLLVIDPLRLNVPIKKESQEGIDILAIQGKFSIDAIIDRIQLKKSKNGSFNIRIKHFD